MQVDLFFYWYFRDKRWWIWFLRAIDGNFSDTSNDSYVSATQIKKFALRTGDIVTGQVRPPNKDSEKYNALLKIEAINYLPVKDSKIDLYLIT